MPVVKLVNPKPATKRNPSYQYEFVFMGPDGMRRTKTVSKVSDLRKLAREAERAGLAYETYKARKGTLFPERYDLKLKRTVNPKAKGKNPTPAWNLPKGDRWIDKFVWFVEGEKKAHRLPSTLAYQPDSSTSMSQAHKAPTAAWFYSGPSVRGWIFVIEAPRMPGKVHVNTETNFGSSTYNIIKKNNKAVAKAMANGLEVIDPELKLRNPVHATPEGPVRTTNPKSGRPWYVVMDGEGVARGVFGSKADAEAMRAGLVDWMHTGRPAKVLRITSKEKKDLIRKASAISQGGFYWGHGANPKSSRKGKNPGPQRGRIFTLSGKPAPPSARNPRRESCYPHICTKKDYAEFKRDFNRGVKDFEDKTFAIQSKPFGEEAFFSSLPCNICGRVLGGDRMSVTAWLKGARKKGFPDDMLWEGEACLDCIYFNEYGQLDDMTMLELEKNPKAKRKNPPNKVAGIQRVKVNPKGCPICGEPMSNPKARLCDTCQSTFNRQGGSTMATNPRRRKRRTTKGKRRTYSRSRRRRRNPTGTYLAGVANPRKKANPRIMSTVKKTLGIGLPILAGIIFTRAISKAVLKEKDYGTTGVLGMAAAALGLAVIGPKIIGRQAANLAAGAGVAVMALRLIGQKYPEYGLTGAAGAGPSISLPEHYAALREQANYLSGYFPANEFANAMNIGNLALAGGDYSNDDMAGWVQGNPLSIHNGAW